MYLLEFEGKGILSKIGIKVPKSAVLSSPNQVEEVEKNLGFPVAIKVQVPRSGRGKAGGINFASSRGELETLVKRFLGSDFQGSTIHKLLVEEKVNIKKEFYVGVTDNRATSSPTAIVSSEGGMDVEEVAAKHPDKVAKMTFSIRKGLELYKARNLAKKAGVKREHIGKVGLHLRRLWRVYREYDAQLAEINPLALNDKDEFVAIDARVILDDNARFRHRDIQPEVDQDLNERERFAKEKGYGYIEFNPQGTVACAATGAGLGMTVMDLINEAAPNILTFFLDIGGRFAGSTGDVLKIATNFPSVKAILIHRYGGFARGQEIAESVTQGLLEVKPKIPVIVQLSGSGEKGAIEVFKKMEPKLKEAGVTFEWSSHITTGREGEFAKKGGIDVIEGTVKRLLNLAGYKYERKPPPWLQERKDWEEVTRNTVRTALKNRPEEEYRELSTVE